LKNWIAPKTTAPQAMKYVPPPSLVMEIGHGRDDEPADAPQGAMDHVFPGRIDARLPGGAGVHGRRCGRGRGYGCGCGCGPWAAARHTSTQVVSVTVTALGTLATPSFFAG